jgi:outer membrane protein, heavy metal efflux system
VAGNKISLKKREMSCSSPSRYRFQVVVLASLSLAGCITLSPEGPFNQVADTIHARLGERINWDAGQYEDPLVRATIEKLLSRPLTPERAVQIALLNNRELQSNYADLGIAQANLVQSVLWPNPILNGLVTFDFKGGSPDYTFDLALKVIDILYIPLRARVTESQLEETKFHVTDQVMSLAAQTYLAFIDYLGERQRVRVLTLAVEAAKAIVESGKALRKPGNITDYQFEAEVTLQIEVVAELARAQIRVAQARERVNRLLGLTDVQTQWRSADLLPPVSVRDLPIAHLERKAIEASVDLAGVRQRLITLGKMYQVMDITSLLPGFDAGGQLDRTLGENEAGPIFAVELPLFDWGQARREVARMQIMELRDRFTALAIRIRSLARLQQAKLLNARQIALYYADTAVPQAQRLLDTALRQYNVMQLGVFQLLKAKERQIQVSLEYVAALTTYWRERTRFAQILYGKLPDEMDGIAGTPSAASITSQANQSIPSGAQR